MRVWCDDGSGCDFQERSAPSPPVHALRSKTDISQPVGRTRRVPQGVG